MSFGYSVSDLVSTAALAWKIYKTCKDSSGEFKNISSEVITLHIVLKEVQDSLTCQQLNQRQEAELESVGKGCNDVLKDLDKLLKKYGSLGTSKSSRVWDRMKWGLEDVKTMRDRLISNTTMLSAFNAALIQCVYVLYFSFEQYLQRNDTYYGVLQFLSSSYRGQTERVNRWDSRRQAGINNIKSHTRFPLCRRQKFLAPIAEGPAGHWDIGSDLETAPAVYYCLA